MLDQGAVGIKEQLCVVDRPAIALVDADRHHHPRLARSLADRVGCGRRYRHGLLEQSEMLDSGQKLNARLHRGKIRVVRHDGFRERRELHALLTEFEDLLHHLFDGGLTVVEYRTDLNCSGFDDFHYKLLD
jgi:hypothetical protein